MINIKELKKLHENGNILRSKPNDWDKFDIPTELLESWIKYLQMEDEFKNILIKYNIIL